MGNDLDVCSKDEELTKFYDEKYGPKNESVFQFIYRTYNKFCDTLINPPPIHYQGKDLKPNFLTEDDNNLWKIREFDLLSLDNRLHGCYWTYQGPSQHGFSPPPPGASRDGSSASSAISQVTGTDKRKLCIIYFPTNQRALNEAVEIFPLAKQLQCDVCSFDYAGCGKSDGSMHEKIDVDIENVLTYLQATIGENSLQMILWARGMSTALIILLLSRLTKQQMEYMKWKQEVMLATANTNASTTPKKKGWFSRNSSSSSSSKITQSPAAFISPEANSFCLNDAEIEQEIKQRLQILRLIKCIVLDSPFLSVEDLVRSGIERMHAKGYYLTKSILYFAIKMIMKNISKRLNGFNLFSVKPIEHISCINYFPCCIIAADNDDYIPTYHGEKISKLWKNDYFQNNPEQNQNHHHHSKVEGEGIFSSIYGNIQFSMFPGRHFNRRAEEVIEITYDFIQCQITNYSNHRFDNLDSILELEKQLKEQEATFRQQEEGTRSESVENVSLKELEEEVMKEIEASMMDHDHVQTAKEHKQIEEEEEEGSSVMKGGQLFIEEDHFNVDYASPHQKGVYSNPARVEETEFLQLIDFDELEESEIVQSQPPIIAVDSLTDGKVSSSLSTRSFSLTHLPQAAFDSATLVWSQSNAIATIRTSDDENAHHN